MGEHTDVIVVFLLSVTLVLLVLGAQSARASRLNRLKVRERAAAAANAAAAAAANAAALAERIAKKRELRRTVVMASRPPPPVAPPVVRSPPVVVPTLASEPRLFMQPVTALVALERPAATAATATPATAKKGPIPRVVFNEDPDLGVELDTTKLTPRFEERTNAPIPIMTGFADDDAIIDEPTRETPLIATSAFAQSDMGLRRTRNEDRLLVLDEKGVFVVADGMGGYAGGDLASQLAVDTIAHAFENTDDVSAKAHPELPRRATELARAIQLANEAIFEEAQREPTLKGMGTTVVAARFSRHKQRLYVAHVGDSRMYRFRKGQLELLTEDHTLSALGIDGPQGTHLSRAVGVAPAVIVDLGFVRPIPDDRYVLCSDGLSKMVSAKMLAAIVGGAPDVASAATSLVEAAKAGGGKDNVTVIVVRVDAPTAATPPPS